VLYHLLQALNALSFSVLLLLTGLGLSLVLSLMNFVNLAHGSFFLLGGYVATYGLAAGAPWVLAFSAAFALTALVGWLLDRFAFRAFYARTHLMQVLLTFGVSIVCADLMRWGFGADPLVPALPPALRGGTWIAGLPFPIYRLFIILAGSVLALALWFALERTRWGAALRACVSDRDIAATLGINPRRLYAFGMAAAAGLAGLGGALGAGMLSVYPGLDEEVLLLALLVVVVGGLGSIKTVVASALLIGFTQTYARLWFPAFSNAVTLVLMLGILMMRPQGLRQTGARRV